jgi:hypothetical protein
VLSDVTAKGVSPIGCSITGLPGHPVENVLLRNVRLSFDGGGTREDATREVPEKEKSYPESTMFGTLPAYGFYCRHVRGLRFSDVRLRTDQVDLRHAMMFDDAENVELEGLDAQFSPGAAAMLRMVQVRGAKLSSFSIESPIDTLLRLDGQATSRIVLGEGRLDRVKTIAVIADEVPNGALKRGDPVE